MPRQHITLFFCPTMPRAHATRHTSSYVMKPCHTFSQAGRRPAACIRESLSMCPYTLQCLYVCVRILRPHACPHAAVACIIWYAHLYIQRPHRITASASLPLSLSGAGAWGLSTVILSATGGGVTHWGGAGEWLSVAIAYRDLCHRQVQVLRLY